MGAGSLLGSCTRAVEPRKRAANPQESARDTPKESLLTGYRLCGSVALFTEIFTRFFGGGIIVVSTKMGRKIKQDTLFNEDIDLLS